MIWRFVLATSALVLVAPRGSGAQASRTADAALNAGDVARAESLYYAAIRVRPGDPMARWALGKYLAERGALKVAATLLEEADQFGGDALAEVVNADLAPVYFTLGDYHALLTLSHSPLTPAEHERVRWLDQHPTRLIAPDTVVLVAYTPPSDARSAGALGHLAIRVQGRTLDAVISATTRGVVVSDSAATALRLHRFGNSRSRSVPAVADSIGFGRLSYRNFPVNAEPLAKGIQAVVGFDVLARLTPTFDPHANRITLRTSALPNGGTAAADTLATRLTRNDVLIARAGGWSSLADARFARMIGDRRWTFDTRRAVLLIEP